MTRSRASPVSAMPNALRSTPHLNPTMFGFTRHDGCWNQCFFNAGPEQLQPTIGWQTRRETPLHKRISQLTVSCTHFFTNIKTQLPHKQDMNNTGFSFEPICVHIDHACCVAWGEKQFNDVGQQKNQIETFAVSQRAACNWPPSFPELQLWWFFSVFEFCFCFGGKKSTFSSIRFSPILPMYFSNLFFLFFACWWLKDQLRKFDFSSRIFLPPWLASLACRRLPTSKKKKEPEIQGKIQKSQQKPPPKFVQKTLLRRTPTWRLEKHKQYFQNAAAWLLSIVLPFQYISSRHFSDNFFSSLSQGNTWSATFWSPVRTLFAKIPLKVQLTQNLPQAFEETWARRMRHWPQNCQKNWAAVMAYICKWHNFSQSTTCFLHIPTRKYSSSSLHVDSCILVFKKFSHRISSFQDLISR